MPMPLRLVDYLEQVQSLVHDFTQSAWSRREMLQRINDARKDVSNDCQCSRSLMRDVQLMPLHEEYSYDGAVVGARITDPGEGYDPDRHVRVRFTPPPHGGIPAEAFARVWQFDHQGHINPGTRPPIISGPGPQPGLTWPQDEGPQAEALSRWERWPWQEREPRRGEIRHIYMTQWGKWYTEKPEIHIDPPHDPRGRRARAEPVVLFNTINVLSISPLWNTLRYTLSYKSFGVYQAWARALQAQGFTSRPGIFSIHQGDSLVYMQPTPDQTYPSEWDVVRVAEPLVGLTDVDREIPAPFNMAVRYKAAAYLLMKHQNFGQSEYYERKYDAYVPRMVAGAGGTRITNPYSKSMYEKMRRV